MLPYRTDAYERQPVQYPPGAPPTVPAIQVPPEIQAYLPHIASELATEASMTARETPLRMFCFNLLSYNNWVNTEYAELVSDVAFNAALDLRKGLAASVAQILPMKVADGYRLWISAKLHQYPELKSQLTPQMVDATLNYLGIYNALKQEILMMKNNLGLNGSMPVMGYGQPQYAPQYAVQAQYPQPPMQQPYMGQYPPQGYGAPPGMMYPPRAPEYGSSVYGPQGASQAAMNRFQPQDTQTRLGAPTAPTAGLNAPTVNQAAYFDRYNSQVQSAQQRHYQPSPSVPTPVMETPPMMQYTREDWIPSIQQPYRMLVDTFRYETYYERNGDTVIELIKPLENPMNREQHAISLLGKSFPLDGVLRQEQIYSAGKDLAAIQRRDLEDVINADNMADIENIDVIQTYVDTTWAVDALLEDAILRTRLAYRKHRQTATGCGIYRSFATIARAVDTLESYSTAFNDVMEQRTLLDVAKKLRSIGLVCADVTGDNADRHLDMALYCYEIDSWLTETVNRFLKHNLSLKQLSIDSFTDDIADLRPYLQDHFNSNYATAYDRFEYDLLGRRKMNPVDDEALQSLKESFDVKEEDGFTLSFIPVNYSLTYVDVVSKELRLNLQPDESLLIQERQTPVMYELASSLFNQMEAWPYIAFNNLLITKDFKQYRLYKGYLGIDSYLIGLA